MNFTNKNFNLQIPSLFLVLIFFFLLCDEYFFFFVSSLLFYGFNFPRQHCKPMTEVLFVQVILRISVVNCYGLSAFSFFAVFEFAIRLQTFFCVLSSVPCGQIVARRMNFCCYVFESSSSSCCRQMDFVAVCVRISVAKLLWGVRTFFCCVSSNPSSPNCCVLVSEQKL